MNSVPTVQANVQGVQAGQAFYSVLGQAGTAQGQSGDFLAIILQQLLGMTNTDAAGVFLGQLQAPDGEQDTQISELSMQMAAEMLAQAPESVFFLPQDAADTGQQTAQQAVEGASWQFLSSGPLLSAIQQGAGKMENMQDKTVPNLLRQVSGDVKEDAEIVRVTAIPQTGEPEADKQTTLLTGEHQFRSSVLEAQKLLKSISRDEKEISYSGVDIEKLQQQVDAGTYSQATAARSTQEALPEAREVLAQVKTGIEQNLSDGKNEFVVKLKPDGLGEITVKVVENDNKMSLSIITSSTQVAKTLSNELAALRESLRPLNADVREVVTQPDTSYSPAQNDQQQFGQSYYGHQHQQPGGNSGQQWQSQAQEEYDAAGDDTAAALLAQSGLDAYI